MGQTYSKRKKDTMTHNPNNPVVYRFKPLDISKPLKYESEELDFTHERLEKYLDKKKNLQATYKETEGTFQYDVKYRDLFTFAQQAERDRQHPSLWSKTVGKINPHGQQEVVLLSPNKDEPEEKKKKPIKDKAKKAKKDK